jgi:transglutaminase-like putative cysteine protease
MEMRGSAARLPGISFRAYPEGAKRPKPVNASLRRDQGAWLLAAAALTLAPHLPRLPAWGVALCLTLLFWRSWCFWHGKAAPSPWVLVPFVLVTAVGIRFELGQFFGKTPGLVFLSILLCLKLLETRNMRDIRVVVFLCFFLQFGLFFHDQSLPAAAAALVALLVTLGSQVALADPSSSTRERLRMGAMLLAQSLPFMLVLFLLFPRAISPLWGIPADTVAITGLSDSMSPGTISELILSDDLAFTVEFDGPPPDPIDRYWRGPVLSRFDGRTWRMASRPAEARPAYAPSGRNFDYRIMFEPHQQHWLPALDYPAGPVEGVRFSYDFQAQAQRPLVNRMQFTFRSYPDTVVGLNEQPQVLTQARRLPIWGNPRARALAAQLKAGTPQQTVGRILGWLSDGNFTYTLQPPILRDNSIDHFLFEARTGFCEHYAEAFVFLARAADIPARVVTGYQGGHVNPINGAFSVRQSDAHAWAEVWFAQRGWVRVDPTEIVAPMRIDQGLEGVLENGLPFMLRPENSWLRKMRDGWEAVATRWHRLVISYDGRRQRDLLETFGLDDFSSPMTFGMATIAIALLMAAFYGWAQLRRNHGKLDPLDRAWVRFSARLAPFGLARRPAEGPLDYGRRLAAARPADAGPLISVCTQYASLRYRLPPLRAEVDALTRTIDALSLKQDALARNQ